MGAALLMACAALPAHAQQPLTPASVARPTSTLHSPAVLTAADRRRVTVALSQQPIRFEPVAEKGMFLARGIGTAVRLSGTSIDFPIGSGAEDGESIRLQFAGARKSSRVTGVDQLPGRINYLLGHDPTQWRTNVPTYARAHTSSLYRGIDIDYYGAGQRLEYDLIVRPGSRVDRIRLAVTGTPSVAISDAGDLVYGDDHRMLLRRPVAYQIVDGARREVPVEYRRRNDGTFAFAVGSYDHCKPLVIDPIVAYWFSVGGGGYEDASDIVVDDLGSAYIGGRTYSADFPTVNPAGSRQDAGTFSCRFDRNNTCADAFLAKLTPEGTALEYATYIGVFGSETVGSIAVDASHALYFTVNIYNSGTLQLASLVGKLTPDGSRLIYEISRPELITDFAVGADGSVYLISASGVSAVSPSGDNYHLIYAMHPLSSGGLPLRAIATNGQSLFIGGYTDASLQATPTAAQRYFGGGNSDGLIMQMTTDGTVVYATFLGGSKDDQVNDLTIDSAGAVYVAADTESPDFPLRNSESRWDPSVSQRSVVAKLNPGGHSIAYSILLQPTTHQPYTVSQPASRIALLGGTNAYTAECIAELVGAARNCYSATIGPAGALLSVSDAPSTLFTVDQTAARYFASTLAYANTDVIITKYAPGVRGVSVIANAASRVRFGTPITWTASATADGAVEYSFWRYDTVSGWVQTQGFSPTRTYNWTPAPWNVGDQSICVLARLIGAPDTSLWDCATFTVTGAAPGEPAVPTPSADFDNDQRPDLVWVNTATGQLAMWNMGGGTYGERVVGGGYLNSIPLPAGWRVAGTGDIDGDGHTDLFLQSDGGFLGAWFFDGLTLRNGISLTPKQVQHPEWRIRAVGDLNHDGHPDLVWQNPITGQLAFWLMDGTTATTFISSSVAPPSGDWEVVGIGDSNRDGNLDLFWQQRSTGRLAVWRMDQHVLDSGAYLSASPSDPKWRVAAVADLDGDGYSDLVLQHADTGEVAAWYLQETTVRNGLMLNPTSVGDPDWRVAGPR